MDNANNSLKKLLTKVRLPTMGVGHGPGCLVQGEQRRGEVLPGGGPHPRVVVADVVVVDPPEAGDPRHIGQRKCQHQRPIDGHRHVTVMRPVIEADHRDIPASSSTAQGRAADKMVGWCV